MSFDVLDLSRLTGRRVGMGRCRQDVSSGETQGIDKGGQCCVHACNGGSLIRITKESVGMMLGEFQCCHLHDEFPYICGELFAEVYLWLCRQCGDKECAQLWLPGVKTTPC